MLISEYTPTSCVKSSSEIRSARKSFAESTTRGVPAIVISEPTAYTTRRMTIALLTPLTRLRSTDAERFREYAV